MPRLFLTLFLMVAAAVLAARATDEPSLAPAVASTALDPLFASAALWETPADALVQNNKGFEWLSTAHDAAQTTLKGTTLFGLPIAQAIVRFEGGKPAEITVLFYNRGDSGEINKEAFNKVVQSAMTAISASTKAKFEIRGKDNSNAVKADGLIWNTETAIYLLEYSFVKEVKTQGTPFRAEFVRLGIKPRPQQKSLVAEALAAGKKPAPFRGADHLCRDAATGDVSIKDIPMVDQGEKGYCVVATSERVLRYYGIKVDANELAQLANSSAAEGTSVSAMTETLKKLTGRFKIHVRSLITIDARSILAMIADYNLLAKRTKKEPIPEPGGMIDLPDIYGHMNIEVLRDARLKNRSGYGSFERSIKARVNEGVPLLWSVMLGVVPEEHLNITKPGGHMRLIIGYNEKTGHVLFSDSWGIGNELKRMPIADAWAITTGLSTVEPL